MTTKTTCPYCGNRVTLTVKGFLHRHNDPATKRPCIRRSPA